MFTSAVKDATLGISRMSQCPTLHPGDVLCMGAPTARPRTWRTATWSRWRLAGEV